MGVGLQRTRGISVLGEFRLALNVRKSLKRLGLIGGIFLLGGCASGQATAFDRQVLLELEEKNVRLEAEVTRLREETLSAESRTGCSPSRSAETKKEVRAVPAMQGAPASLPEVRMTPSPSAGELPVGAAVIRPAADVPEEEEVDPNTRPVLKVRGEHEAWVYHRPLTDDDRATDAPGAAKLP